MTCVACGSGNSALFVRKNNCDIFRCRDCALLFVHPAVVDASVIYSDDYFRGAEKTFGYVDYDADKEPMIPTFHKYLSLVEKLRPAKGKLLDIGEETGFFINIAGERGWSASGIEVSDYAAAEGRRKGLDVKTGTLSGAALAPESVDAVTMFDVVEHFPDPAGEIRTAGEVLKKGGVLAINTPDAGSMLARFFGKKWHILVPPEHLYYFNRANLALLLEKNGFRVVAKTRLGKRFTLQYIFKMLHMWQRLPLWKKVSDFFSRRGSLNISLPVNTRDNLFVIAVKK